MKIIFMGTPEFAIPSLNMLINEGYDILAVVTQPDKPKGRGNNIAMPPIKEYAIKKGIQVLQPDKIKTVNFVSKLKSLNPDLLITVAYGKILSQDILDIPKFGCINVHASLLPKYRGAAPINWAIINGEKVTGVTTMFTNIGMDTGDILLKQEIEITDEMTAGELHDKLSIIGTDVLKETINNIKNDTLKRFPQSHNEATHTAMMKKEIGLIDWSRSTNEIHNRVRGTNPWPGAYTFYKGQKMRIWKTTNPTPGMGLGGANQKPGTICDVTKNGIVVATLDGVIQVVEVQFDCCRKLCVSDFICGNKITEGETFE